MHRHSPILTRTLVWSYFLLTMVGYELANKYDIVSLRVVGCLPAAVYITYRLSFIAIVKKQDKLRVSKYFYHSPLFVLTLYIAVYITVAILIYLEAGLSKIAYSFALIVNCMFWYMIFNSPAYLKEKQLFFKDFFGGIALTFILTGFIPSAIAGHFYGGGLYNFSHIAFFWTTLNPPLLAAISSIISFNYLKTRLSPLAEGVSRKSFSLSILVNVANLAFSVLALWLFNRRGPMFAFCIAVLCSFLPGRLLKYLLICLFCVSISAPLSWEYTGNILAKITQNEFGDRIIAKNAIESYHTATKRNNVWDEALDIIKWKTVFQNLFGYGDVDTILGINAHNSALQLFLETGLFGLSLLIILVFLTINRLYKLLKFKALRNETLILCLILIIFFNVSAIEALFRLSMLSHLIFLSIIIISNCTYNYAVVQAKQI